MPESALAAAAKGGTATGTGAEAAAGAGTAAGAGSAAGVGTEYTVIKCFTKPVQANPIMVERLHASGVNFGAMVGGGGVRGRGEG